MNQYEMFFVTLLILTAFLASLVQAALLHTSGQITLLRVHDLNTGFGPKTDFINTEVVCRLSSKPGKAFGFQLRNDNNLPARQGMLNLLRDAFIHNLTVHIDYRIKTGNDVNPGDKNGIILRVWLTK